jgi:hypothetical protein
MSDKDKTAEKVEADKTTEMTPEQAELSAEELAKIAGGDIYQPTIRGHND